MTASGTPPRRKATDGFAKARCLEKNDPVAFSQQAALRHLFPAEQTEQIAGCVCLRQRCVVARTDERYAVRDSRLRCAVPIEVEIRSAADDDPTQIAVRGAQLRGDFDGAV